MHGQLCQQVDSVLPGAQVIQYKQLVGNERDASVQQDIDQAIDTLVQQLRLQVCTFLSPFRVQNSNSDQTPARVFSWRQRCTILSSSQYEVLFLQDG